MPGFSDNFVMHFWFLPGQPALGVAAHARRAVGPVRHRQAVQESASSKMFYGQIVVDEF